MNDLRSLGWDEERDRELAEYPGLEPARVAALHRGKWRVRTADDERWAIVPGRLRATSTPAELPAVGDWVAVEPARAGDLLIRAVLPRRTLFIRRAVGREDAEQVLAANVDTVFVVTSADRDLNLRRIERSLALAYESGAQPAIVLTKIDRADDLPGVLAAVEPVALGAPVHPISNVTGEGFDALEPYLQPARTIALLGSSGVGKSTLVNRLLGEARQATGETRDDGKGRHTTTHRELVRLASGALVVDSPGIRELGLIDADEGVEETFPDIVELAASCRFRDCAHDTEPGCAVKEAVERGAIPRERLLAYRKLVEELREIDARSAAAEQRRQEAIASRALRKSYRIKGR